MSHPHPVPLVKQADLFNPMLTLGDIMKREAPTCSPDAPIAQAVRILRDSASEAVFVVSDGRPLGLLTDRRIALAAVDRADQFGQLRVQDLMKLGAPMVRADARLDALLETFTDEGVAVVDKDGRLQGVVRWLELLGQLSERALGKLVVNLFSPRKES